MNQNKGKIKILIVDDSLVIQKLLSAFISRQPDMVIVGVCTDPFQASQVLSETEVDCMILDLELPKMDGVTFLKKLNKNYSINTIVLSGLLNSNPELKTKLIEIGAADALSKPGGHDNDIFFKNLFSSIRKIDLKSSGIEKLFSQNSELLIVASSTGSTENIRKLVTAFTEPPTVIIVQHMGSEFTNKFAKSLNLLTHFEVGEAQNTEIIKEGHAYIAPGNFHLKIVSSGLKYSFELSQETHVHGVRPSADVTLLSLPKELAKKTTVVVLSGMGKDGAAGLAYLKDLGASTIAESERTSVVFGMPKAAIETGKVDRVFDFNDLVTFLTKGQEHEQAG